MPARISRWKPPENVRLHNGDPIPPDADFFAPPPADIGPILSASTDLTTDKVPMNLAVVLVIRLTALVVPIVACYAISAYTRSRWFDSIMSVFVGCSLSALAFAVTCYLTSFHYKCKYVGKNGLASFTCFGNTTRIGETVAVFGQNVRELRISYEKDSAFGKHVWTTAVMDWYDRDGNVVFNATGFEPVADNASELPDGPTSFGRAALRVWSEYRFPAIQEELGRKGIVRFKLLGAGALGIRGAILFSRDDIQLVHHEEPVTTLRRDEIISVAIRNGQVFLNSARKSGPQFAFWYKELGDADLLLLLLEREYGVRIT